jgi:hypothetical protein
MGGINIPGGDFNLGSAIKLGNASGIITATSFSGVFTGVNTAFGNSSVNTTGIITASRIVSTIGTFTGDTAISGSLQIADTIQHEDDVNTKIRFPSNDTISFETNGSEKARVITDGNIGIGTTLPNVSGFNADAKVLTLSGPKRGIIELRGDIPAADTIGAIRFFSANNNEAEIKSVTDGSFNGDLVFTTNGNERLHIESTGDIIFKNNGGDNRIERDTISGGPYLLFHNRGTGTTDNSNTYNMGGIAAAGYRDVANPSIVAAIQFERQITASGASSGGNIVFRTGFNGTTSHTGISKTLELTYEGHLLPGANNQYDLGSTAKGWRNVYMNDLNLSNMNGDTNDVDGTQGSWTIQEGKDDLYIINRLNGKKFKIKMEEIS